jgi:hypothetical protein
MDIDAETAGMVTRMFSGIASLIISGDTSGAKDMAMLCARQFNEIAAEWKPLTDKEYMDGLEASRARQAARSAVPVAHFKGCKYE